MGRRQVVRHWVLVPAFAGSNPADPATEKDRVFALSFSVGDYAILNSNIFKHEGCDI